MALKPRLTSYGSYFGRMNGDKITDLSSTGEIDTNSLNKNLLIDGVEFSLFDRTIKDYILARLGEPIVRVELSPFQIKVAIDEAVTKLSYHCPLWTKQYAVFDASAGYNVYQIPLYILDNLTHVVYRNQLFGFNFAPGSMESDMTLQFFTGLYTNMGNFSMGDYLLVQMYFEQIRKIMGSDGRWDVLDGQYLQIYPIPQNTPEPVILEYRALNSNTLHPAYRNWIQKYALAVAKGILGEIRGKYAMLPSPGGCAKLNGDSLKAESIREMELLETQLLSEIEEPPGFSMY